MKSGDYKLSRQFIEQEQESGLYWVCVITNLCIDHYDIQFYDNEFFLKKTFLWL